ncbi:MAG: hypothetical protein HWN65_03680 [Candidatus Helarchaeota archaeon]|nr:hypothetical protein [Candidatus Helarchaeota archaeon]
MRSASRMNNCIIYQIIFLYHAGIRSVGGVLQLDVLREQFSERAIQDVTALIEIFLIFFGIQAGMPFNALNVLPNPLSYSPVDYF